MNQIKQDTTGGKVDTYATGDAASSKTDRLAAMRKGLAPLASLKITIVLFALGLFLVFAGTIAQVEKGIWDVMASYFRSWMVWIPLSIFTTAETSEGAFWQGWAFPFPGGWLLGTLLIINLLAAHAIRFKIKAKESQLTAGIAGSVLGIVIIFLAVMASTHRIWPLSEPLEFNAALWVSILGLAILMPPSIWLYGKRTGIVLLHAGIIILLLNELVTGLGAREGQAFIEEGKATNYLIDIEAAELAIVDPQNAGGEKVISVPEAILKQGGKTTLTNVPFDIEVMAWYSNSAIISVQPGAELRAIAKRVLQLAQRDDKKVFLEQGDLNRASMLAAGKLLTPDDEKEMAAFFDSFDPKKASDEWLGQGECWMRYNAWGGDVGKEWIGLHTSSVKNIGTAKDGLHEVWRLRKLSAGSGVDGNQKTDMPSAYVKLTDKKTGEETIELFSTLLTGPHHRFVTKEGKRFDVSFRFKRRYKDYTLFLIDFKHDRFTGTNTPSNFSSKILLIDKDHPNGVEHLIKMNDPLRYRGETFFQASFMPGDHGTVLQVVQNPGYLLPYISCIMVSLGMMMHFGLTLKKFVDKQV